VTAAFVGVAGAFIIAGVLTVTLPSLGLMDVPNQRSSHLKPVPRGGGLAWVPVMLVVLWAAVPHDGQLVAVILGLLVLATVGLVDDVRPLPALMRLAAQVLVSAPVSVILVDDGEREGAVLVLAAVACAMWLTSFVNMYNFMDGANGLAALCALVAGAWFAYLGNDGGSELLFVAAAVLAGCAVGFLPWNFPRARLFLGDVGSYAIGFLIGCLAVLALLETGSPTRAFAPVIVLVADTTVTLLQRWGRGEPVLQAHRDHAYQRLGPTLRGGGTPGLVVGAATCLCVAGAMLPVPWCLAIWFVAVSGYLALPAALAGRS
jgi:UDP-N-acetylmuramyl pentapeptide phosphotransferase/UDP-N-acetylglucosamine-1-phosphate transferase